MGQSLTDERLAYVCVWLFEHVSVSGGHAELPVDSCRLWVDLLHDRCSKGPNPALSLRYTIWLHLFMDQNHRMWIGRLSKAASNISVIFVSYFQPCVLTAALWDTLIIRQAREGMAEFPLSVEKSTMEALWHSDDSFYLHHSVLLSCHSSVQVITR